MKTKNYLYILCLFLYNNIFCQDFHFSQFNENPSLINPALAGASSTVRASVVYKSQWKSVTTPYTTYGVSFDEKFKASNWEQQDARRSMTFKKSYSRMAGGLSIYNDKAGDSKMGTLQANLSLAMSFPLNKLSSLAFGLQGTTVQRKIDNTKLLYPNQYNGSNFDANLPTGENYSQQNFSYSELGAGILWSYGRDEKSIAANNQLKALIGFSTYHINRPKQKFIGGDNERLYRKYVFHGNVLVGIQNSMFAIVPSWLVQLQGPSKEIVAGTMVKYYVKDDSKYTGIIKRSSIGLGVYYRNSDAVIASLLIETGKYAIGFSYDINASSLTSASKARGGFEINLKFVTPAAYLYQKRGGKALF